MLKVISETIGENLKSLKGNNPHHKLKFLKSIQNQKKFDFIYI